MAYIRDWARREGHGLPISLQLDWLSLEYQGYARSTLREILVNDSWFDPTYDRTVALPDAPSVPAMGLIASFFCLLQLLLAPEALCSRSPLIDR